MTGFTENRNLDNVTRVSEQSFERFFKTEYEINYVFVSSLAEIFNHAKAASS